MVTSGVRGPDLAEEMTSSPTKGYFRSVVPLEDARAFVVDACEPLAPVRLPVEQIAGLVLAESVIATEMVPPFANTAVDGYAVRAADVAVVPAELRVVGRLAAGAVPDVDVGPGQAVRIMTGAPIPAGADAIVMVEDSEELTDGRVRLSRSVSAGTAVRSAGEDVMPGDLLFVPGTEVRPAVHGVLHGVNARRVSVHPRARVAVLSTGDELVTDGSELRPGQIRESNLAMLVDLVAEAGCEVSDLGVIADDEDVLEAVLRDAARSHDAIITSGGVSMGDYDVVKAVLGRIAEMRWMQIAIKPAKPFAFGRLDGTPVFGLPGNPVSSLLSFEMLARPALRRMMGHRTLMRRSMTAMLASPYRRRPDGKQHLVRVVTSFDAEGRCRVEPVAAQGSHQLAATALADAIAIIADGDGYEAGSEVEIFMLVS